MLTVAQSKGKRAFGGAMINIDGHAQARSTVVFRMCLANIMAGGQLWVCTAEPAPEDT